jgi:peptidoglycan pentaglycine glycine transferase (the first glycine)
MEIRPISDAADWDNALSQAGGHLLQTWAWGEVKAAFGWSAQRLAVMDCERMVAGAQVLYRRVGPVSVAYAPRGPWGNLADVTVMNALLAGIHAEGRRRRAVFLKVEPPLVEGSASAELLTAYGFQPSPQRVQPLSTIVVDLSSDLAAISARFKPKWRYNVGLAARRGVSVRFGGPEDVAAWYRLMELTGKRDGFGIHPEGYYRRFFALLGPKARLLLAEYQGRLLAGIGVAASGTQAIYMYGASSDEQRNLMPNHLLQWEAMQWAKDQGCIEYDLWGIPDEVGKGGQAADEDTPAGGAEAGLAGVYRFKSGFGGRVVRTVGAWDHVYSPPLYWLYARALPWYRARRAGGQPGQHSRGRVAVITLPLPFGRPLEYL